MLKLYNTLTHKKEDFIPAHAPLVTMYACGPTVYDYAHIGNLRTYVFNDILLRVLFYNDFNVKLIMNITDVGHLTSDADSGIDKMEKGAEREQKSVWEIAAMYTEKFMENRRDLNMLEPTIWAKATDNIKEMISLVSELQKRKFTYRIEQDGIYFDTARLTDYGKLAKLNIEGLKKGARITFNPNKRNPTDFALWKFAPENETRQMEWSSPWGEHTFPGWHIECSAMSMRYLSNAYDPEGNFHPAQFETIDLHTGGVDHIAVHHTNEIAQSEAATDTQFVKYWVHAEHLLVSETKMAKSEGNFITLETLKERDFDPLAYRYFLLNAHYRTQLNFTWEALEGAQRAYKNLALIMSQLPQEKAEPDENYLKSFRDSINNDLNMPQALAVMWDVLRSDLAERVKRATVLEMDRVFGLKLSSVTPLEVPQEITALAQKRQEARAQKNFKESDILRKEIASRGFEVEDTKDGFRITKKVA